MNCFRFANFINKTAIINTFNSEKSNVTDIKPQYRQFMTTIKKRILKFKPMIKMPITASIHSLLLLALPDQFLYLNHFYSSTIFIRPIYQNQKTDLHQFQKDFHQDNLSFACFLFTCIL